MHRPIRDPDRRSRVRRRIAKSCVIHLGALGSFDAILREFDAGGARVKVAARGVALTGRVELEIRSGEREPFWVVWQIGQQVGLRTAPV